MGRPAILPPIIGGITYNVQQLVSFLGQRCQFGHYYNVQEIQSGSAVPADYVDIADYWRNTVIPKMKAAVSVGTDFYQFRIWSLSFPNVATFISSGSDGFGTVIGDPMPPQIALVATKRTALRGKSARGRMYFCGFSENNNTNGAPDGAQVGLVNDICAVLKVPFVGTTTGRNFVPVVVALKQYNFDSVTHPDPPALPQPAAVPIPVHAAAITAMESDLIWNTQRPRTIGKGQ